MSFARRLIHRVTIIRVPLDDAVESRDEIGQPAEGEPVRIEHVPALVQPKTARELADYRSAGAEVGAWTIFMLPQELYASDALEREDGATAGLPFEITGIRRYEFGRSPHLEVDADLVTAAPVEAIAS